MRKDKEHKTDNTKEIKETGFLAGVWDDLTLAFFGITAGRLSGKLREEQLRINRLAWENYLKKNPVNRIEHQPKMNTFRYGKASRLARKLFFFGGEFTAADNCCEVIAVYNLLMFLAEKELLPEAAKERVRDFPDLLRDFSERGICAGGLFGTSPFALRKYLKKLGCRLNFLSGSRLSRKTLTLEGEAGVAAILTSFNRGQDPFSMVHTMCVTKEEKGWQLHNDYEGSKCYASLFDAVYGYRKGTSHPISLLVIH